VEEAPQASRNRILEKDPLDWSASRQGSTLVHPQRAHRRNGAAVLPSIFILIFKARSVAAIVSALDFARQAGIAED
jgi:hypothetical protein